MSRWHEFLQGRSFAAAVANVGQTLLQVAEAGATDILVSNLPGLKAASAFWGRAGGEFATLWTEAFKAALAGEVGSFQENCKEVHLLFLDSDSIFTAYTPGSPSLVELFRGDGFHHRASVIRCSPMLPDRVWLRFPKHRP